jgi:hypothetical protein
MTKRKPKIHVMYATEFGPEETILEIEELLSFTKRFKVLIIEFE